MLKHDNCFDLNDPSLWLPLSLPPPPPPDLMKKRYPPMIWLSKLKSPHLLEGRTPCQVCNVITIFEKISKFPTGLFQRCDTIIIDGHDQVFSKYSK